MSEESELELAAIKIAQWVRNCGCGVDSIISGRVDYDQSENSALDGVVLVRNGDESYERVSIHEAAHAVVGKRWNRKLRSARVRVDGTGVVEYQDSDDSDPLATVVSLLAGVAVEVLRGADGPRCWQMSQSADVFAVRNMLNLLARACDHPPLNEAMVARLAVCTVSSNLEAITRVAALLRAVGEVDDATVTALCRSSN